MGIGIGAIKFINSLIGGIGGILFLLGTFYFASTGKSSFAIIGLIMMLISEALGIYLTKYESKKEIEMFRLHMFQILGTMYAFPVLLFILNYFSPDRFLIIFSIALTAAALVKTVAVIAKAAYIERNY